MSAPRLKKIASLKELETAVEDYVIQGYEVITQGDKSALMRKKTWGTAGGHLMCALFTLWFTFGIGNAIYAAYAHHAAEQILIKFDQPVIA